MSEALLRRLFPRDLHHAAGLHKALARHLPAQGRVLDLGCGANRELAPYRNSHRDVWGSDFNAHPALEHPRWFRALRPDGTMPFPDGFFDAVVTVMVLEHVDDSGQFLAEVSRVLRPGGAFIAHSISGRHYVTLVRRLIGLFPHSWNQWLVKRLYHREEVDTFPAYYWLNTPTALDRAIRAAGLSPLAIHRYADPGYFRFSRPVQALAILADKLLEQFPGGWGRLYFTFVAERNGGEARPKLREGGLHIQKVRRDSLGPPSRPRRGRSY